MAVEAHEIESHVRNLFPWNAIDHSDTEIFSVSEQPHFFEKKNTFGSSADSNDMLSEHNENERKNEDVFLEATTSETDTDSGSLNRCKKSNKVVMENEKTQEKSILVNHVTNGIIANDSSSDSDVPLQWLKIGKKPITFDSEVEKEEKNKPLESSAEKVSHFSRKYSTSEDECSSLPDYDCIVTEEIFDVCIISDTRDVSDYKVSSYSKDKLRRTKQTVSGIKRHNESAENKPAKLLKKQSSEKNHSLLSKKKKYSISNDKEKELKCAKPSAVSENKVKESKCSKTSVVNKDKESKCIKSSVVSKNKVKELKCTKPSVVSKDKVKELKCSKPPILSKDKVKELKCFKPPVLSKDKVKELKCSKPSVISKDKIKELKCSKTSVVSKGKLKELKGTKPSVVSKEKVKELKCDKPSVSSEDKVKELKNFNTSVVKEQTIEEELNLKSIENTSCDKKSDVPREQKVHIIHLKAEHNTENLKLEHSTNSEPNCDEKLYFEMFDQQLSCICINSQITFSPEKSTSIIVRFKSEGMCLELPRYKTSSQTHLIMLTKSDVERVLVYCDKYSTCFISIITSSSLGEDMKNQLKTCKRKSPFYNPDTETTKQLKLSFLLKNVTNDIFTFLHDVYGEKKVRKINCEAAFTMLKSPPPKKNVPKLLASNIFVYPSVGGIQIKTEDIDCLAYARCLNDTIIEFYLKYIYHEKISSDLQKKTHMFTPFFYQGLERVLLGYKPQTENELKIVDSINKWTKNVDIFSKDFIFIPINKRKHWFLAIVCYLPKLCKVFNDEIPLDSDSVEVEESCKTEQCQMSKTDSDARKTRKQKEFLSEKNEPCICFFDSSDSSLRVNKEKSGVGTILKYFLQIAWESKNPGNTCDWNKLLVLKACCPQQKNVYDCGIYLLQYVESFFEKPLSSFQEPLPDLRNWFSQDMIKHKRLKIKTLISELKEKYTGEPFKSSESVVECS